MKHVKQLKLTQSFETKSLEEQRDAELEALNIKWEEMFREFEKGVEEARKNLLVSYF